MPKQDGQRRISPFLTRLMKAQMKKIIEQTRGSFIDKHGNAYAEKLTQRAYKAIGLAYEEAVRLQHGQVQPAHILLGLLAEEDGIAAIALHNLDISFSEARTVVEQLLEPGANINIQEIQPSSSAQTVIDLALVETRRLQHRFIGTEHLLLGLTRNEEEKEVNDLLESLDVTGEQIRIQVMNLLEHQKQPSERVPPQETGTSKVKGNVVMCRLDDDDLAAIDMLIEAGIRTTRSDAASWLIHAGIQANQSLLHKMSATVAEIKRLREQAQSLADEALKASPTLSSPDLGGTSREAAEGGEED